LRNIPAESGRGSDPPHATDASGVVLLEFKSSEATCWAQCYLARLLGKAVLLRKQGPSAGGLPGTWQFEDRWVSAAAGDGPERARVRRIGSVRSGTGRVRSYGLPSQRAPKGRYDVGYAAQQARLRERAVSQPCIVRHYPRIGCFAASLGHHGVGSTRSSGKLRPGWKEQPAKDLSWAIVLADRAVESSKSD
jgi:hypothetical protein